jgi:1,4-dihydroxy-2-naphthoate polyprenyltransferase
MAAVSGRPHPGRSAAWWTAIRPRTLWAAAAPVLVGTAVAWLEGGGSLPIAGLALLVALALQIGCNLANDVYDAERGVDTEERRGPPRVTQQGWLPPSRVKAGMGLAFAVAAGSGLGLVWIGGWPLALIGALALWAAWAYAGGPWTLADHALGDAAVFAFFGLVAVGGTAYVQTGAWSPGTLWAAVPVGALATAILVVNNLRDLDTDARAGKRTLAVVLGPAGARGEYGLLVASAYVAPVVAVFLGALPVWSLLVGATAPPAAKLVHSVTTARSAARLDASLAGTARLLAAWAALFAVGSALA